MRRFFILFFLFALLARNASAVGTRTFDLDTLDEFSGGDLDGVAIGSDGVVRTGLKLGDVRIEGATTVFAALARADGSVLLATSPGGKIFRVAGDQASEFCDTKETGVTSLAEDARGNVYAATFPDGRIYKVSQGKADVFVTLPDTTYVWALAFDKTKTNLYAAVGLDEGRVFRVSLAGQSDVLFRSDEPHLVSLAVAPNGDVLAGSSGKGLLYRITGPGRATVLYDFSDGHTNGSDEVKAIAAAPDGTIWAIANQYGEPPDVPRRSASALRAPAGPATTSPRPKPGKGQLWRFDPQGRPEKMMSHSEFHYMALALDDSNAPYVGTGAEGRVYTVDDAHTITLAAHADARQITALSMSKANSFVVSSDGASFRRVLGRGGANAMWTSKAFDAGGRARFGTLSFRTAGPANSVEISTRTGNTQTPDNTWSMWSNGATSATHVASPAGRYVQVRAKLLQPTSELTEVVLPFVTDNLRAIVTDVSAQSKSLARETHEGFAASGGEPQKHDSTVHVVWRVENPDQDALRFRLAYKREGDASWRNMLRDDEILAKTDYDWETATLPEGKYRVRVEASDELANPPDQALKHALETESVLVDNTPPVFATLTMRGRTLKARVVDGASAITRVDVALDGRAEWHPLAPTDGIFDSLDESFDANLAAIVSPGAHIVAVRAFDSAGNFVVREISTQ